MSAAVAPLVAMDGSPSISSNGDSSMGQDEGGGSVSSSSLPAALVESVGQQLASLGVAVQPRWVRDALAIEMSEGALPMLHSYLSTHHAAAAGAAASALPHAPPPLLAACRDCLWSRALLSSLLRMGAPRLPPLRTLSSPLLAGTHVVQLLECADVAHSASQLAEKARWDDRVWKLLLTDGHQTAVALERRRCNALTHAAMQTGVKLAIRDVPVRHGVLLLEPGNVELLGGGCPPDEKDEDGVQNANGASAVAPPAVQARVAPVARASAAAPAVSSAPVRQPLPGASAAAASASSMAAQSSVAAPAAPAAAFVAASALMSPQQPQAQPQPQPQQPSMWAIRAQQQAAAAAAGGSNPPQQPARQPAPSFAPPPPVAAAAAANRASLPLPLARDVDLDDDAWMEDEEALQAVREAEEAEERRQRAAFQQQLQLQQQAEQSSAPSAPLFTAASLLASDPSNLDDAEDDDVVELERAEDPDLPPLSQSMPGLETAPSILDYVSPVISKDAKHDDATPTANARAAAMSAANAAPSVAASASAPAADFLSLLTPPDRAPASAAAAVTPQSVPTLTPMSTAPPFTPPSTAFSTVMTASSPAVSSATIPAASSAAAVKTEKGAGASGSSAASAVMPASTAASSSSTVPAAASSRPAAAASSAAVTAAPSRAASRAKSSTSTSSPGKVKKEGVGAAATGTGTLDAFLTRGPRVKTQEASSRCSSPSSDGSSVMLVSPPKKPGARPAAAGGIKPEALAARLAAAVEEDDLDDFLESDHHPLPAAPLLPQIAPAPLPPASGAAAVATAVPDEVSPAVLKRGLEVSQQAVSLLFPLKDPLRPHYLSLPHTYLHLLPTLAQRIQRPLHVLVHARIMGVLNIRLDGPYVLEVQIQDDHSACALRFAPAYMEALLGCTAEHLSSLSEADKEPFYDRLQAKIEAPAGIMQLRIHPHSLPVAGGMWLAGPEPEIMDMRATTDADTHMMEQRKPMPSAIAQAS